MEDSAILVDCRQHLGLITFNRPQVRNALSFAMWQALPGLLAQLADNPEVRVVILRGHGRDAFASGADISEFKELRSNPQQAAVYTKATTDAFEALWNFPKPLIAMVHGFCVGGGSGVAICCDMRFADEKAKFGIPAAKLGLPYEIGGVQRLVQVLGPTHAKELLFTARLLNAQEALSMGLVNQVLPTEALEDHTLKVAESIANNAPLAVQTVKFYVSQLMSEAAARDQQEIARRFDECYNSNDYADGVQAFLDKRTPEFTGT